MSEDNAKSDSVENKDNWSELRQIGDVFISCGRENNQVILILENQGQNEEDIEVRYQESQHPITKPLESFDQMSPDKPQRVQLPTGFEHWEKLHFNIGENAGGEAPIASLIAALKEPRDEVKSENQANEQLSIEPEQQKNSTSNHEKRPGRLEHEIQDQQANIIPNLQNEITQLEQIVAERQEEIDSFREQIAELTQKNSELKRQLDTRTNAMSREPEHVFREAAHRVLQTLLIQQEKTVEETLQNPIQICEGIETEIERFEEQFDGQMIYTLSVVKEHLTKAKGLILFQLSELSSPEKLRENQSEQLANLVLMDEPPDNVQFPYLGELGKAYWDDLKAFTKKLPQIIVETQAILHRIVIQLLDGFSHYRAKTAKEVQMSCCFYEDYLPNILQMMSLELVPIKIGQTEADSRIHDIQDSQRGAYQRGVVADIIQHGVRRISDKQIIRKPVVIRGEPE